MRATIFSLMQVAGPSIANHLWQSTVFVVAVSLLTVLLRRNRARVRYVLWLWASAKFLIPFSALMALGSLVPHSPHRTQAAESPLISAVSIVNQPFSATEITKASDPSKLFAALEAWLPIALAAIWASGFVAVWLTWCFRWKQVSNLLRKSVPNDKSRELGILRRIEHDNNTRTQIRLLVSNDVMEPGVCGIIRPVLLWPERLSERLDDSHLEAILVHEVAHVQRRDNLAAAVHMIVEAIFWFHPFVWWIESKMIQERERACDEAVVELSNLAEIYAEGLLRVSRFCAEFPMPCVAGINGSDLSKRIRSIMSAQCIDLGIGKRLVLALFAMFAVAGPLAFGMMQNTAPKGQILHASGPLPSFEVASIKPNHSGAGPTMIGAAGHAAPKDRFIATNITAEALICWAFGGTSIPLPSNEVSGGPSWIRSERYDIDAKLDDSQTALIARLSDDEQIVHVRLMVQSLLSDRFKLVAKDSTVTRPIYALVLANGGPKIRETVPGSESPIEAGDHRVQFSGGRGELSGHGIPMTILVRFLSQAGGLGRPLVDQTGLSGKYDVELKWNPDLDSPEMMQGPSLGTGSASPDNPGPSIFTALQDQLGLRLKATEGPVEDLEIAHIEKPSEN
ncbi:TIGR03435 family protein [Acidobacteria bacterium AB60]|nr:TIGR03435 family protein [Acidobacteria bacterium AB60]